MLGMLACIKEGRVRFALAALLPPLVAGLVVAAVLRPWGRQASPDVEIREKGAFIAVDHPRRALAEVEAKAGFALRQPKRLPLKGLHLRSLNVIDEAGKGDFRSVKLAYDRNSASPRMVIEIAVPPPEFRNPAMSRLDGLLANGVLLYAGHEEAQQYWAQTEQRGLLITFRGSPFPRREDVIHMVDEMLREP
jgi:hypothetical protein